MKKALLLFPITALIAAAGCADTRQSRTQADFGTSQKLAIYNQIYNPEAEKNLEPVTGLDAQAAIEVVDKYRDTFKKSEQPVNYTINIGK